MNDKISSLKEKFRLALTSTAKVIADDFDLAGLDFFFWAI